jgi:hypothetical protein
MIFKNNSASDMEPFSTINLTGIERQPDGQFRMLADQCDSAANFLLAVTSFETVGAGKWGQCTPMANVFQVKYDTADGTPANEESWGADNGTSLLKKNFGGGQHAVIGADTTSELAVIMHTAAVHRWGKADTAIVENAAGTVSIYSGTGSKASWVDTSDNVTARNLSDSQADAGSFVWLTYKGSEWTLLPLECPA